MGIQVKCEGCGADLVYKPGTTSLTCSYCDHQMAFSEPVSNEQAGKEISLVDYLRDYAANSKKVVRHVIDCKNCGAETEFDPNQKSGACPFCDSPLVIQEAHDKNIIRPQGILPFAVEKQTAKDKFRQWLSKLWFAPTDLKKQITQLDKFTGIYLPFWTYDCITNSVYIGQRGDYYYDTVTQRDNAGNTKSKKVRKTRWSNRQGQVQCNFDDVLVSASQSLPEDKLLALEPWDLKQLVDYSDDYLRGYKTETYQIDLKQGYENAKKIMGARIKDRVKQDIGGDAQRIVTVKTAYREATFKHILLPVWISAYRYRGKLYQIMVNARTGEVQGNRPWSWIKITALVITIIAAVAGIGITIAYFNQAG